MRTLFVILALAAAPLAVRGEAPDRGAVLVGAKFGGLVPLDDLDPNVTGAVEVGWLMPWLDRSLAVVVEVGYAQPSASGSAGDPRVGGAAYDWKLVQRELVVAPTALYRLTGLAALTGAAWTGRLVPYAGIGPRVYLLESVVSGSAGGQGIAETKEQATKVGFGVPRLSDEVVTPSAE